MEITTKPDFESLPSPRLIKSHLTADAIPKGSDESSRCKYIYVSRNPKDVSVSMFFFLKSMAEADTILENAYNGPWEFFVELFIEGDGRFDYCWNTKIFYLKILVMVPRFRVWFMFNSLLVLLFSKFYIPREIDSFLDPG